MTTWKPGDVASFGGGFTAFRTSEGWAYRDGSIGALRQDQYRPRPLVVVDPESAEDIDRLCDLIAEDVDWLALQAALREFAAPTPPKPAEPTGLGAVIEDAEGNQWIKVVPTDGVDSWRRTGVMCGSLGPGFTRYNDIAAVSVLSDGWDE